MKKKTKCMLPPMACPFSLVEIPQPNSMGVTKGQGQGSSSGFHMYKHDPIYFLSGSLQILTNFLLELLHQMSCLFSEIFPRVLGTCKGVSFLVHIIDSCME